MICTFVFVNGLYPVICIEWVDLMWLARDRAARNHIVYLPDRYEQGSGYTSYA